MIRLSCSGCSTILVMGMVGALFAGPRGLLAGLLFGTFWTMLFSSRTGEERGNSQRFREMIENMMEAAGRDRRPDEAVHALSGLFMAVVRQNERGLREIHIRMSQQILRIYAAQGGFSTRQILDSFQRWETREIPVKELAGRVVEYYPRNARKNFLQDMMMVAFADGQVREDEEGILRFLTDQFELTESDYEQAFRRVQERLQYSGRRDRSGRRGSSRSAPGRSRQSLDDAYDTLGLDRDADQETVKSRYREMAREYHPDNYTDEQEAEQAQEKMVEINKAYKRVMDTF